MITLPSDSTQSAVLYWNSVFKYLQNQRHSKFTSKLQYALAFSRPEKKKWFGSSFQCCCVLKSRPLHTIWQYYVARQQRASAMYHVN
jgi:hypothetical protein